MSLNNDNRGMLFFRKSSYLVAKLLFGNPNKEYHIRKIGKETGLSTTAVVRAVEELRVWMLVTIREAETTKNVQANMDEPSFSAYKRILNLYELETSGLVKKLVEYHRPLGLVLFGSYGRGEDIEESDIDLLLLGGVNVKKVINTERFELSLGRKINIHCLENLEESSKEFVNGVANGIVLYGHVGVIHD